MAQSGTTETASMLYEGASVEVSVAVTVRP